MAAHCFNTCENILIKPKTTSTFISSKSKPYPFSLSSLIKSKTIQLSSVPTRTPTVCSNASTTQLTTKSFENKNPHLGKRTDIKKIMILGAGPIVIGQACEFDYSGTQACKALRENGYQVVLINSNPATIMTDPEMADRTYIEPMTPELVEQVIAQERPDAILPTMGGQTALNLAVALAENGVLDKYNVELIGAKLEAIKKAEDRDLFKQAMKNIGLKTPPSGIGTTLEECFQIAEKIGEFPLIIRPAFTLGGSGGGIAYNREEFEAICKSGLAASVTSQVLVEKSLLGWKEYELEVMRDLALTNAPIVPSPKTGVGFKIRKKKKMILTPTIPTHININRNPDSTHHRLLEAVKTALIKIFVSPYATVCDLYCGRVPDEDRWDEAQIGHFIGIDEASSGVKEVGEAWESQRKTYTSDFYVLNPCVENLEANLGDKVNTADIVCCMQHLQFCFETEEKVRRLLQNVSSLLKPGGYLLGITLDSSTIWAKYQKNVEAYHNRSGGMKANVVPNCIRSENYMITFEVEEEKFPFFGKKYQLKFANEASAETHCLVHFPSLIRLAREAGLEYVEIQNLLEFYDDNRAQFSEMLLEAGHGLLDPRGRLLSKFYDILGLYTTFIFQKPDPDVAPPLMTPLLHEGTQILDEREWQGSTWRDEDKSGPSHTDSTFSIGKITEQKGILGPGPPDLRFSEAM